MDKIMSENNIDQYRVVRLSDIHKELELLYDFFEKRDRSSENTEFEEKDISARVYPDHAYDKAKSVIVIFFPYLTSEHDLSGNISVYAQAQDYHIWGKDRLEKISEQLKEDYPQNSFYLQIDNGPLNERFFAYISGLGKKGINSMIINEKYGSYGFIGLIITDRDLESFTTQSKDCSKCMICQEKCPGQAILGDFTIDSKNCASYISQTKSELTKRQITTLKSSGSIFGCDVCQKYCPDNSDKTLAKSEEDMKPGDRVNIISKLEYIDIGDISNKVFKNIFGEKSFSWRGKKILMRNLDIIEDGHKDFMIK